MSHEFPMPWFGSGRQHRDPAIIKGGGPERVATEEPPKDWKPAPLLGFGAVVATEAEPLTWDGDGA